MVLNPTLSLYAWESGSDSSAFPSLESLISREGAKPPAVYVSLILLPSKSDLSVNIPW
jgi:hypothetical protein